MKDWRKETEPYYRKCYKCREKIEANEERYVSKLNSFSSNFYHLDCGEEIQREIDIEVNQELKPLISELAKIKQKESNLLTFSDYQEVSRIKRAIDLLSQKNLENPFNTSSIKLATKSLQELKQEFPQRIKLKVNRPTDGRGRTLNNCYHKNIYWKLDEVAYCLDCGEDENDVFLSKLSLFCQKKVDDWVEKNNLKNSREVLGITSKFYQVFVTQNQFKQTYQQVVNELNQLAKRKGVHDFIDENNQPKSREREREREREQKIKRLQQRITKLENKPTRTPTEEAELTDKKAELANLLANHPTQQNNSEWLKPVLIISGSLLVVGLIVYLIAKKKNGKR